MGGTLAGLSSPPWQTSTTSSMGITTFARSSELRTPADTNSDKAVESTRRYIDLEVQRLEDSIRTLKSRRNTLAPIARLSPELLSKIFIFCSHESSSETKPLAWIKVSHISRSWRAVALDCPDLWGGIVFSRPKWTEEMLRRSKIAAIIIKQDLTCVTPRIVEAVQLALLQIFRVRELRLSASSDTIHKILTDLPADAPMLQTLSLSAPRYNRFGVDEGFIVPKDIFSGGTSPLRKLELVKCNLSWDSPLLSGLTHLKICETTPLLRPTISMLIDALERMPALEVLELRDALPLVPDEQAPIHPPDRVIDLPQLSQITIGSSVPEAAHLLNRITFPRTASLNLTCRGTETTDHDFSSILRLFSSSPVDKSKKWLVTPIHILHVSHISPNSVFVKGWSSNTTIKAPTSNFIKPNVELNLSWYHHDLAKIETVMAAACGILPLTHLRSLHASHLHGIKTETWASLFGNLPMLQEVRVRGGSVHTLVSALREEPSFGTTPFVGASSSSQHQTRSSLRHRKLTIPPIFFPDLKKLSIEDANFEHDDDTDDIGPPFQNLVDCLMERCERKAEIRELRLQDCSNLSFADVKLLKEIAVDIDWDEVEQGFGPEEMDEDDYGYRYDDLDPSDYGGFDRDSFDYAEFDNNYPASPIQFYTTGHF